MWELQNSMFLLQLNDAVAFGCEQTYSLISNIIAFAAEVNFGDKVDI